MSALSQAVKFRSLADELDLNEYNKFLSNFLAKCGRNIVLKWLFTQFTSNNDDFCIQTLNDAVNEIKNIIQSREIKPNQLESDVTQITMDSLPRELYREIASYLKDKEYIAFSKTNRSIYIGCNSPNCLKYLDLTCIPNYSCINLQKYPQIEHLKIHLNKFNQLQLPPNGITICNQLKQLTLNGDSKNDIDIDKFLNQNTLNINNLTELNLNDFGAQTEHWFSSLTFSRLLSKFKMVQYLRLQYVFCDTQYIENNKLMELVPNLQGFEWMAGVFSTPSQFIELFANKLKALTFWNAKQVDIASNATFDNLQDLIILAPRASSVNTILKTAKNLRRVRFDDLFIPKSFTGRNWKDVMFTLLSKQKMLQYLEIMAKFDHFGDICDGLESGIYENDTFYQDIKIKLEFELNSTINARGIFVNVLRILNQLQSAKTGNFMLIVSLQKNSNCNDEEWNKERMKFIDKNAYQYEIYCEGHMIIITNKQCTINGYLESWLMDHE